MAAGEGETVVETPVNGTTTTTTNEGSAIPEKKEILEVNSEATQDEKKDAEKATPVEEESIVPKKKAAAPPPASVHKKDYQEDIVYLYQFNRCHNAPSLSPYCFKVESWMKLNNIKYENVDHKSKLRSRKGLLPFIELNGEEISDSSIIIKALSKKFEKDLDDGLTHEQKNVQHAMLTMVDNHLLWLVAQWRNRHVDNLIKGYKVNLNSLSGYKLPAPLAVFYLKHTFLRKINRKIKATGLGEYKDDELDNMGKNDLKVLSDLLGDKQFFFGDEPHSLDLNAFVQLTMLLCVDKDVSCPLRDYLESDCTNLVGLFNRMKDRVWGDHWDEATGESLDLNPHIPKPEPPAPAEPATKEDAASKPAAEDEKKEEEKEKADNEKEKEDDAKEKDENKEKSETDENKESEEKK